MSIPINFNFHQNQNHHNLVSVGGRVTFLKQISVLYILSLNLTKFYKLDNYNI